MAACADSGKLHHNNFNILRFAAALMVLYGHICLLTGRPAFLLGQDLIHAVGVKLLFVVSGFLITKSYLSDPNFLRYMLKRCFRIFPALLGVVLLSIFLLGPCFTSLPLRDYFSAAATWTYLRNLLFFPIYVLPGVFTENVYPHVINGALWTLPVEFTMYLLVPLFVLLFRKKRLGVGMAAVGVLLLVVYLLRAAYFPELRLVLFGTNWPDALPLLPYFFMGSALSQVKQKRFFNLQLGMALLIALLSFSFPHAVFDLLALFVLPYCALSFALAEQPLFAGFLPKTDLTYGLYLYGFPVQQVLCRLLLPYSPPIALLFLLSVCIALPFALFSLFCIEKPMGSLLKRLLKKLE